MKKIIFLVFLSIVLLVPVGHIKAQSQNYSEGSFRAVVLEVLQEEEKILGDGTKLTQQNVKLKGIEGDWENKEVIFNGVSNMIVTKSSVYKKGDKVVVSYFQNQDGENIYYITDFVRTNNLYFLAFVFILAIILVSKWKGVTALISLFLSFLIIMKMVLPMISDGYNPLLVAILGSFFILFFIIYLTEGFNRKSHYAILSIAICLGITAVLSYFFTQMTKLSGMTQEEALFLVAAGKSVNFQGLLLAGIIIGTLGVLDDIVISQIEAINQIKKANRNIKRKELFEMANKIGSSHLGAITNTLFLAYAGVSLPLLMLFNMGEGSFVEFGQIINNEMIATEIVRTLVGVIGLTLSIPITNLLMVYFYNPEEKLDGNTRERFNVYKKSA